MNILIVLIIVAAILLVVPKLTRSPTNPPAVGDTLPPGPTPPGGVEKQCVNCPGCSACIGVKSNKIIPKIRRSVSVVEHFENKDNRPSRSRTASRATSYARGKSGGEIPMVCHRIVGKKISDHIKPNLKSFTRNYPNIEQKIHYNSGEDYMRKHAPPLLLKAWLAIRPEYYAARSDLARYFILYNEGGLYLDDKSNFTQNLNSYLNNHKGIKFHGWRWDQPLWAEYLENPKGEICNWGMISAPKHSIPKDMILNVCMNAYSDPGNEGGKFAVLRTTGPLLWSRVIQDREHESDILIQTESTCPAVYTIFNHAQTHENIRKAYYGDFTTPVFNFRLLPNKNALEKEITLL